jgi:biopolymer transport protein TolR
MAMGGGGNGGGFMSEINVTPLVDVMLVLLIIFMVTAPMMVQGVDVALPEATTQPLKTEKEHLIVTVDKHGQVTINDFTVGVDSLKDKLAKILQSRADQDVYLRADKEISYGMVVRVMAEIKAAGVQNLGMVTIPLESDRKGEAKRG